jgi:lipoprotein-anchoring transpeptidase ErfK/SrfK
MATIVAVVLGLVGPIASGQQRTEATPRPLAFAEAPSVDLPFVGGDPAPRSVRPGPRRIDRVRTERAAHRERTPAAEPALLVRTQPGMIARRRPAASASAVGVVATRSRFYGAALVLWVEEVTRHGGRMWGRVELPYAFPRREGWIPLRGLTRSATAIAVRVDLSRHLLVIERRGEAIYRTRAATGAAASPTPPGDYVVTDRVPFSAGSYLGSFAFGISGIQPRLPAGWSGGDQLAIHGTDQPWSIGRSASAGCVRVSESTLARLRQLLRQGTPVIIEP